MQDFGDLSVVGGYLGATSDGTRGIFGGRMTNQPYTGDPTMNTVIIASKVMQLIGVIKIVWNAETS